MLFNSKLWKASINCRWRTSATRCFAVNVLQTKVDAQCDKIATELNWQRLQRLTFSSYSNGKSPILTYPTYIWRLRWGDTVWGCRDLRRQKTRLPGLSCGIVCVMILCLAVSVEHRLMTNRQPLRSMASCGKNWWVKDCTDWLLF